MKKSTQFYTKQIDVFTTEVAVLKKRLWYFSMFRLSVFLLTVLLVYLFWNSWQVALVCGVLGTAAFLFLISRYTDLKDHRNFVKALLALNQREIEIGKGNYSNEPAGEAYVNPTHFYSLDIDLFGKGSFFQYINRTGLKEGTDYFAHLLTENSITDIDKKQAVIQELASKTKFRQSFTAASTLIKTETPNKEILGWLKLHTHFTKPFFLYAAYGLSAVTVIAFVLVLMGVIPMDAMGYVLAVGLFSTAAYLKKVTALAANTEKARDTFKQYSVLLKAIEEESFSCELLKRKQAAIKESEKLASTIFKDFSKLLDALDSRNNMLGAIFGNGFFLMDLRNSYRIEKWMQQYGAKVSDWFEVVAWFDAYNTLGNFAFNHEAYVYPVLTNDAKCIHAEGLGHPLLNPEKRVDNNLSIDNRQFFIVTGANMAGKSTFLRTVSLHIVMANLGLPVCAVSSKYTPVKLITSMRTSDSLNDDSSYFFSELTRLKYIVDALQDDAYFIILDEILKGTNSTDKAIGSRKFVEKLVKANATGIIATHDLSLCELEDEIPQVANHYFDAEIVNDELYFDYRFKDGVCQNMNASFLLRKMEII
ncbi:MutS-related protein [Neptunitalea lumnitzerae]|uniref:DNA mismatch repair protein MutS n=1 Tax=Neptunitalea lumnitzerae TaxID=2965509 RepID=A0ABQ5MN62_9FLAO|nr:DNA mismatch repair protein MutS [Neptunitalea sp. Y10]GLB50756.1 DNA mismatch repair protein MutS [Neptunitalea sp. Y10]